MIHELKSKTHPKKYTYELKKPAGFYEGVPFYESLGYIEGILDETINWKLDTYDDAKLEISKFVQHPWTHQSIKNKYWDLIKTDYIIEVTSTEDDESDDRQLFLVQQPLTKSGDKSIKEIPMYSLEYEYVYKTLHNFKSLLVALAYPDFYDPSTIESDTEVPVKLRHLLEYLNSKYMQDTWSIGEIAVDIDMKYRSFDFADGTIWQFFAEIQKSFNCIFKFDTINRTVSVYDLTIYPVCPICKKSEYLYFENGTLHCYNPELSDTSGKYIQSHWSTPTLGKDLGLYLSDMTYIKEFSEDPGMNQVSTQLYVYGNNDLSINSATSNITGQSYLLDFRTYRNDDYMTSSLQSALDKYDLLVAEHSGALNTLLSELSSLKKDYSNLMFGDNSFSDILDDLEFEIQALRKLYDIQLSLVTNPTPLDPEKVIYIGQDGTKYTIQKLRESYTTIDGMVDDLSVITAALDALNKEFNDRIYGLLSNNGSSDMNAGDVAKKYSMSSIKEAIAIYEKRIATLKEVYQSLPDTEWFPSLSLSSNRYWKVNSKITFKFPNTDFDTIEIPITPSSPYVDTSHAVIENGEIVGYTRIYIPSSVDYNTSVALNVFYSYKDEDGKDFEGIIIQGYHFDVLKANNKYYIQIISNNLDAIVPFLYEVQEAKQATIDENLEKQEKINQDLNELQTSLSMETAVYEGEQIFTNDLLKELNRFIKSKNYTNSDIGVADINEDIGTNEYIEQVNALYDEANKQFSTMFVPTSTFDISIVNFLRDPRFQDDWDKIRLGDLVHVGHKDSVQDDYIVRVVAMSYNKKATVLDISLSNDDRYKASNALGVEFFQKMTSSSNAVMTNKKNWNKAETNAVGTIIKNGLDAAVSNVKTAGDVNVEWDDKGIRVYSTLSANKGKEMRIMNGMIAFTDDNWATSKTCITNGKIIANYLMGNALIGENLHIVCNNKDGTVQFFKFDENGAEFHNAGIRITSDGTNSNGINLTPEDGITVFNSAGTFRIIMNKDVGLLFQKKEPAGEWSDSSVVNMVELTPEGNVTVHGDIYAKSLFLGEIGGGNVITYIDENSGTTTSSGNSDAVAAIKGKNISVAGLNIQSGNRQFSVGSDASVMIRNGNFTMSSNSNIINMNPNIGLLFTSNGAEVIKLNIQTGEATFGGTIDTKKDCLVGDKLVVGKESSTGRIDFAGMINDSDAYIEVKDKDMTLDANNFIFKTLNDGSLYWGERIIDDNIIVRKKDLDEILLRLTALEQK